MEFPIPKPGQYRLYTWTLLAFNTAAIFVTANLVLTLEPEDRISIKRGSAFTFLGFVYFTTLFELLNVLALTTAAGAQFRTKYKLSCGDILDINNKVVSAIQALLCVLAGVVVCTYSCRRDLLRTSHHMSEAYAWFGAAYFFYDIWSMYLAHIHMNSNIDYLSGNKVSGLMSGDAVQSTNKSSFCEYCLNEPVILMHHLFIGGFGFAVIVYLRGGLGDCVFGFVYLMEISTPFVCLRGILSRLKLKASKVYLINGLAMLGTFFVFRVCSLPYVMLLYARVRDMEYFEAMQSLPTGCKISICILLLPQLYWFYLMLMGAIKVFTGKSNTKDKVPMVPKVPQGLSAGDHEKKS